MQTILELKRMHEISKLETLIKKTIKEENDRSMEVKRKLSPSEIRLSVFQVKQNVILKIMEPSNYSPI